MKGVVALLAAFSFWLIPVPELAPGVASAAVACGSSGSTGGASPGKSSFQAWAETDVGGQCAEPEPGKDQVVQATNRPKFLVLQECARPASSSSNLVDCSPVACPPGEVSLVRYPYVAGKPDWTQPQQFCSGDAPEGPAITPAMILAEIRKIPLPKPALKVQPPGGRTLVNFPTIFSTSAQPIARTLTLAGVRVDVRIEPATYVWTFGDAAAPLRTSIPGRPWADGVTDAEIERGLAAGFVTHEYVDAQVTVNTHVEVVHTASFSVAGGPWQEVGETVTAVGPAQALKIVEARPVLVG